MRLAFCFGIGLCIPGGVWLLWPFLSTRPVAMAATLVYCIGLIATRSGVPVRLIMVDLHLELQATFLGFTIGHQLFDVYPQWAIWSGAVGNVVTGVVVASVVGMLGTAGLLATRRLDRANCTPTPLSRLFIVYLALLLLAVPKLTGYDPRAEPPPPPPREPIYDATMNVEEAIEQATGSGSDRHVLLMLGGNWCGWCYRLHDLLHDDPDIRKLMDGRFRLIHVDIRANQGFYERYEAVPRGYPFLIVLDTEGNLLTTQNTDDFVDEGQTSHDPQRVYAFLAQCLE